MNKSDSVDQSESEKVKCPRCKSTKWNCLSAYGDIYGSIHSYQCVDCCYVLVKKRQNPIVIN